MNKLKPCLYFGRIPIPRHSYCGNARGSSCHCFSLGRTISSKARYLTPPIGELVISGAIKGSGRIMSEVPFIECIAENGYPMVAKLLGFPVILSPSI